MPLPGLHASASKGGSLGSGVGDGGGGSADPFSADSLSGGFITEARIMMASVAPADDDVHLPSIATKRSTLPPLRGGADASPSPKKRKKKKKKRRRHRTPEVEDEEADEMSRSKRRRRKKRRAREEDDDPLARAAEAMVKHKAATQLQSMWRRWRAMRVFFRLRFQVAKEAGVMCALPGTIQGRGGWYQDPTTDVIYCFLVDENGDWIQLANLGVLDRLPPSPKEGKMALIAIDGTRQGRPGRYRDLKGNVSTWALSSGRWVRKR